MSDPRPNVTAGLARQSSGVRSGVLRSFTFSIYMTLAILTSYFPTYFDSLGYTKLQIGMLYSIGPAIGIAANLVWAMLSDKWQTLKKTIVAVLAGQLAMMLLLLQSASFALSLALMAAFYFFQTPLTGLNDSQLLLAVRANGRSYASYRVMGSIGFAFAALVFGLVLKQFGTAAIAYLVTGTIVLSLLLALLLTERQGSMTKVEFGGLWSIVLTRQFLAFVALVFLVSVAHRSNDGFLALYLTQLGADPAVIGYSWTVSALCEIPVFFLLSKYGSRYRELPLLALAALVYAVRFFLMSEIANPYWIIAVQTMHSLSFGIFLFTSLRFMQHVVPDKFRATGQAVFNITWGGMAGLIGGTVGGRLFDEWGGQALYRFSMWTAAAACVGFTAMALLRKRER